MLGNEAKRIKKNEYSQTPTIVIRRSRREVRLASACFSTCVINFMNEAAFHSKFYVLADSSLAEKDDNMLNISCAMLWQIFESNRSSNVDSIFCEPPFQWNFITVLYAFIQIKCLWNEATRNIVRESYLWFSSYFWMTEAKGLMQYNIYSKGEYMIKDHE